MSATILGVLLVLIVVVAGVVIAVRRGEVGAVFKQSPQPTLDPLNPLLRDLAVDLRALDALPISTKEERKAWYDEVQRFRKKLHSQYAPIYDQLPHELEHYLSDADIRADDPGYARNQKAQLSDVLSA